MTDTPTLDLEKLAELRESGLVLTTGHHDLSDGEFATGCAMDLIGWQVTGDSTDMPECVHPTLARHVHRINDGDDSTSEDRWRIVMEAGPLLVGTAEWSSVKCCLVLARAGLTAGGLIDALRQVANLNGASLNGASLYGASLYGASLYGANLDGANLDGANLNRANLDGASLYGASLDGANLDGANLYGANLNRANLDGASLYGANLDGASLDGANLYGANLYGANLDGANLNGANLDGASLYGASLYGASLDGANLYGANLYGASLNRASLNGARGDAFTRLPAGWKVNESGLIVKVEA